MDWNLICDSKQCHADLHPPTKLVDVFGKGQRRNKMPLTVIHIQINYEGNKLKTNKNQVFIKDGEIEYQCLEVSKYIFATKIRLWRKKILEQIHKCVQNSKIYKIHLK